MKTNKIILDQRTSIEIPNRLESLKHKLHEIMQSSIFIGIMMLLIFWILIQDPVKYLFFTSKYDFIFYTISFILFGIFALEIIIECWVMHGYFLSFYFWLDSVCILMILLDIGWVQKLIFGSSNSNSLFSMTTILLASKASEIGAKAARITRVIRII